MPTACSGLFALRGYIGANSAPTEEVSRPSGAVIATRPRCTLSTKPLRTTSTRMGSVSKGLATSQTLRPGDLTAGVVLRWANVISVISRLASQRLRY